MDQFTMFTIGKADETDIPEIHEVIQIAFEREAQRLHNMEIEPLRETSQQLLTLLPNITLFVAREDGRIVGTGRATKRGETTLVGRLAVHPDHQRKGIAKALIKAIEDAYPESTRYEVFTSETSYDNINLYTKAGYKIYGRRSVPPPEQTVLVMMEKTKSTSN